MAKQAKTHGSARRPGPEPPSFVQLLHDAVTQPGVVSSCYQLFHAFSIGNQLAAWAQCIQRGIPLGPLHTFRGWLSLDRHVKRGEAALVLCMPVIVKDKTSSSVHVDQTPGDSRVELTRRRFIWRPNWFTLA
jgi:hypothetical protein